MLNERSLRAVAAARINEERGRPLYGSYCFSELPQLVRSVFIDGAPRGLPADVLDGPPKEEESDAVDDLFMELIDD